MSPRPVNHYERLGLPRDATPRQVARAFHRAARTAHPDSGGTDADFAAVAEAYRVLSDPAARAAYDRELDGEAAGWDDVGWGMEVHPPASESTPHDVADGAGGVHDEPLGDAVEDDGDGVSDPWLLDPLVGGPRRLPDPLAPRVMPDVPGIAPSIRERVASIVVWGLLVAACALRQAAGNRVAVADGLGSDGSSDPALSGIVVLGFYGGIAIILHATKTRGSRRAQWAWFVTALAGLTWFVSTGDPLEFDGELAASSAAAFGFLGVGIAWARLYRDRLDHPARLAALLERDRTWVLDRYHRAVEWNRVRAALMEPGRVAVVVGAVAADRAGSPVLGRRWTYDPRTGTETVRLIPGEAPHGSWVVLDDEDRVVATAPAHSPEAWLDALRAGVPRPS